MFSHLAVNFRHPRIVSPKDGAYPIAFSHVGLSKKEKWPILDSPRSLCLLAHDRQVDGKLHFVSAHIDDGSRIPNARDIHEAGTTIQIGEHTERHGGIIPGVYGG